MNLTIGTIQSLKKRKRTAMGRDKKITAGLTSTVLRIGVLEDGRFRLTLWISLYFSIKMTHEGKMYPLSPHFFTCWSLQYEEK